MQAVILAAGKSTRTYPLTITKPKPLLKIANKTLLEHNLDNLSGIADEVIIVVGYKKKLIKKYIGSKYKNLKIRYVGQNKQLGTAHAVSLVKSYIKGRFLLLMGDDVYSRRDIKNCIKHSYSILTTRVKNPKNFGVVIEIKGILAGFVEKPKKHISDLVSTAFYALDKSIFTYIEKVKKSERNEFELPDAVRLLAKEQKVYCVKSSKWLPIGYPRDLLEADRILRKNKTIIGKNSKICGKIENSSVGNNCIVRGSVKNSIIMDYAVIGKNSVVNGSIVGENTRLSGKIYGSVIADNVKAENVYIKNCRIWPNKIISNKTITQDLV